jgi:hypothetical protein
MNFLNLSRMQQSEVMQKRRKKRLTFMEFCKLTHTQCRTTQNVVMILKEIKEKNGQFPKTDWFVINFLFSSLPFLHRWAIDKSINQSLYIFFLKKLVLCYQPNASPSLSKKNKHFWLRENKLNVSRFALFIFEWSSSLFSINFDRDVIFCCRSFTYKNIWEEKRLKPTDW